MVLTNDGSAPSKNIVVKTTVPDKLKAIRAAGQTKETIAGNIITFEKIAALQPGTSTTIKSSECQGVKVGDCRFKVEYTSDLNARANFTSKNRRTSWRAILSRR